MYAKHQMGPKNAPTTRSYEPAIRRADYLIIDTGALKELWKHVTDENAGRVAVHLEWLMRVHPKFKSWYSATYLTSDVARAKDKQLRVRTTIEVILLTLRQRRTYRI